MKKTVVLRGGPLDGHIRDLEIGQRVAYIIHKVATEAEAARLGIDVTPGSPLPTVVLIYQQQSTNAAVWDYLSVDVVP